MQSSKLQFTTKELISPILIIFFAVALRLLPHPANVAPIAAIALFGGVYLNKKYALIIPLIAMLISDFFLGFHPSIFMVYLSFLITGVIGIWLSQHKKPILVISAALFASIIFFLLTNFNYWYATPLYPKTFSGLMQSYENALPFLRNSIVGDLWYVGLFFGAYELGLRFFKTSSFAKN